MKNSPRHTILGVLYLSDKFSAFVIISYIQLGIHSEMDQQVSLAVQKNYVPTYGEKLEDE